MKRRYTNLDGNDTIRTYAEVRQWQKERKSKQKDLSFVVPRVSEPEVDWLRANRTETTVTWIGHSSFLVQIGGYNILLDPIWSAPGPFTKRLSPPGLMPDQLPDIDAVLISHGHYDHLQFSSLRRIKGKPLMVVPAGLKRKLIRKGFANTEEFDWWEKKEMPRGLTLHFVPAQHWTRRTLRDTNTSHWGGWVMEMENETIYFAGDSGYFRGFREIGERFDIDIALMPIGAYEPEWFMGPQHVTPEEAVQAFRDVQARVFIPMHYGAFRLADDAPKEALDRLEVAWRQADMAGSELHILKLGEVFRAGDIRIR